MERCLGENVAIIREVYKKMAGGGSGYFFVPTLCLGMHIAALCGRGIGSRKL